ncbi:uncharacterized protein N7479_000824 [Penicillium vulpinum]|uniref:Copper-fist domain-containing protein n=1 Tax=Penicillium vulpinum TaxID=29845 RepID=A0A1V6S675_9EURO|nr:uncharacterized protein N7479_000824 [Penicillium vulpinum]KAJ5970906.1 hypothetical protein N7479_000824 [Penicillium vulpinum]OQE09368.1 hypothetical protein PENVUL_c006G04406 [Penicillium vulpinum]
MLIDGHKWACEACIRGHRVTSCKHHDRPLIRIKRKGRPFATCTMCNATPCTSPMEHARAKRDAELKCPSKKASSHGRLYPRQNPNGFLPIAPRPRPSPSRSISGPAGGDSLPTVATKSKSRSGSKSGCSISTASSPGKTIYSDAVGAGDWSGSEGSMSAMPSSRQTVSFSGSVMPGMDSSQTLSPGQGDSISRSAPGSLYEYPVEYPATSGAEAGALFDPAYSLQSSTLAVSSSQFARTMPMVSPLEGVNPFDFSLDPALELGENALGYLNEVDMNMDLEMPVMEEVFHVEDWSRYMWSAETGFEHLDTGFPPVSQQ